MRSERLHLFGCRERLIERFGCRVKNGAGVAIEVPNTSPGYPNRPGVDGLSIVIWRMFGSDFVCDLMKIDVEGHELQALQGMQRIVAFVVAFSFCYWQNDHILNIINVPLDHAHRVDCKAANTKKANGALETAPYTVPPPTAPSSTGPPRALFSAANTSSGVMWRPRISFK